MLVAWLKALHIAALSVWAGGLLALPGQLARERRAAQHEVTDRLGPIWEHRVSRFDYDLVISPAAILTIGSGTALIFVTRPLEGWLFLKLVSVAALVGVHMYTGRIIDQLGEPAHHPTPRRALVVFSLALVFICLILFLVLQKPVIPESLFPGWLREAPDEPPFELPFQSPSQVPEGHSGSPIPLTPT